MLDNRGKAFDVLPLWKVRDMSNNTPQQKEESPFNAASLEKEVRENEKGKDNYPVDIISTDDGDVGTRDAIRNSVEGQSDRADALAKNKDDESHLYPSTSDISKADWTTGVRGVFLTSIYLMITSSILIYTMNYVHQRMPLNSPPLPDVGHDLIPKMEPENLGDRTMMVLVVSQLVAWYFNSNRYPNIIKFLLTLGNLYLLRIASISVTSLPPTDNHCRLNYKPIPNVFWNTVIGIFTFGSSNIHCGDLMFSGHTCMVTTVWMSFMTTYKKKYFMKFAVTLLMLITFFLIIATRSHYTGDIWIAFWLTALVYKATPSTFPFTKEKIVAFFKNAL